MEPDRYQNHHKLFIICMVSLIASLSLFAFSLYIVPYLIWDWHYNVPEFVSIWSEWLVENRSYSETWSKILVFLSIFIPAVIMGLISYLTSNRIENEIFAIEPEKKLEQTEPSHEVRDTLSLSVKLLLLMIVVLIVVYFFQWLLAVPPQQEMI